jgi:hypothetical protein
MALVSDLRIGIKNNLATIAGLRTSDYQPDNPQPPMAIVLPQNIQFDNTFQRGMVTYTFSVIFVGHRVSERSGQNTLDSYVSGTGANSIKRAVESDKTLGGKAFDVRVTDVRNYGDITIGEGNYLSAEFVVLCYAD